MCSTVEELRLRTGWDGARGPARRKLLSQLQRMRLVHWCFHQLINGGGMPGYIPSSVMIPQRRISTLLNQAFAHQREHCVYHNSALPTSSQRLVSSSHRKEYSLYIDHVCEPDVFPRITTMILDGHKDEVWNLQWSHNGVFLATCGRDERLLVWKFGVRDQPRALADSALIFRQSEENSSASSCTLVHDLSEHGYPVAVCAWSLDDSILLAGAEQYIKMWNRRVRQTLR